MSDAIARASVAQGLKNAVAAHREGRVFDIGDGWDDAASVDHDDDRVSIALNLWEQWADSAVHGWLFYPGLTADDWPRLARSVIESLEYDREITDPEVLKHFVRVPQGPSALSRLVRG